MICLILDQVYSLTFQGVATVLVISKLFFIYEGTLMLTDCIDLCRRNSSCKSANFETGLCVLFGSSAEEFPGKFIFLVLMGLILG